MPILDIFNTDPFSVMSLTDAIQDIDFQPGRLGQMGIFQESGITTTSAALESRGDILELIPPTPRGAPGTVRDKRKRTLRHVGIPHFEINDAVMAEEVQGVRAFGAESETEMLMDKLAERFVDHTQAHAVTQEYSRVGAVKGIITYADASTLDIFSTFDVTQETEIDFDLDNASPASGALRKKCSTSVRTMANNLGGVPYTGVHAICGDAFFDDLIAHPEVVASYQGSSMAAVLREGVILPNGNQMFGVFEFGGIVWENYRGSVDGTDFVDSNKCHIFPTGTPGLFRTYYAPADYIETVNTQGRQFYAKQYAMRNGKGIHLDVQMNALEFCTRPKALLKGKRT